VEGATEMKAYLEYVRNESRAFFDCMTSAHMVPTSRFT
jgi:hypothetical protein